MRNDERAREFVVRRFAAYVKGIRRLHLLLIAWAIIVISSIYSQRPDYRNIPSNKQINNTITTMKAAAAETVQLEEQHLSGESVPSPCVEFTPLRGADSISQQSSIIHRYDQSRIIRATEFEETKRSISNTAYRKLIQELAAADGTTTVFGNYPDIAEEIPAGDAVAEWFFRHVEHRCTPEGLRVGFSSPLDQGPIHATQICAEALDRIDGVKDENKDRARGECVRVAGEALKTQSGKEWELLRDEPLAGDVIAELLQVAEEYDDGLMKLRSWARILSDYQLVLGDQSLDEAEFLLLDMREQYVEKNKPQNMRVANTDLPFTMLVFPTHALVFTVMLIVMSVYFFGMTQELRRTRRRLSATGESGAIVEDFEWLGFCGNGLFVLFWVITTMVAVLFSLGVSLEYQVSSPIEMTGGGILEGVASFRAYVGAVLLSMILATVSFYRTQYEVDRATDYPQASRVLSEQAPEVSRETPTESELVNAERRVAEAIARSGDAEVLSMGVSTSLLRELIDRGTSVTLIVRAETSFGREMSSTIKAHTGLLVVSRVPEGLRYTHVLVDAPSDASAESLAEALCPGGLFCLIGQMAPADVSRWNEWAQRRKFLPIATRPPLRGLLWSFKKLLTPEEYSRHLGEHASREAVEGELSGADLAAGATYAAFGEWIRAGSFDDVLAAMRLVVKARRRAEPPGAVEFWRDVAETVLDCIGGLEPRTGSEDEWGAAVRALGGEWESSEENP